MFFVLYLLILLIRELVFVRVFKRSNDRLFYSLNIEGVEN